MEREILTFAAFALLAVVFNSVEGHKHMLHEELPYWKRVLLHENTLHTLRDYSIHLAVYSGYVLGH